MALSPTELWLFVGLGFLGVAGIIKVAEEIYEAFLVGQGFLKVFLMRPNRRATMWYSKPKDKQIVIEGMAYAFSDDPDYMPVLGGLFVGMPTIFLDSKTNRQIKVCNTNIMDAGNDPRALDGAGKLSWSAGFLEGAGDLKQLKMFFIILLVAMGLQLVVSFMSMNGGKLF